MTFDSLGIWLGAFAGLVGAYFLFVDWREKRKERAKPEAAPMDKKPLWTPNRRFGFLAITVLLAWAVTLFNFANREWLSVLPPPETPLGTNNARIDVKRWLPILNEKKQFIMNAYLANDGKAIAEHWAFQGLALTGALNDKDMVDAFFIMLRTKLKETKANEEEMQIGQDNQFISVPNIPPFVQWDDSSIQSYKSGNLPVFIFLVLQYTDNTIKLGKHIYGEKCIYIVQDVIHSCLVHNRNFIAD